MATGMDDAKLNQFKIDLLGYVESLNAISSRLGNCKLSIQQSIDGAGKIEIISKINSILGQMPVINANINTYISVVSKERKKYEALESELAADLTRNISKLSD